MILRYAIYKAPMASSFHWPVGNGRVIFPFAQVAPVAAPEAAWDDEEEFEPPPVITHGDAPKLSTEKEEMLKREKAAAKAADIAASLEGSV